MHAPKSFVSDTRNVGGRQHVIETMLAHQSKLRQIVSAPRGSRPASAGGAASSSASAAAATFSSAPASYHLSRKLSAQRARKTGRLLNEQGRADQNMLRRMEEYPLPAQRGHTPSDHRAHPVKLFRDASRDEFGPTSPRRLQSAIPSPAAGGGMPASNSSSHPRHAVFRADHFASAVPRSAGSTQSGNYKRASLEIVEYTSGRRGSRPAFAVDSDHVEPGKRSPRTMRVRPASASASAAGSRGRGSAPPASAYRDPSYTAYAEAAADDHAALDALSGGGSSDPYVKLRSKLFALIVEHRIYREAAILKLLEKAKQINGHLNQVKLERVLEEIKIEFEINPNARLGDSAGPAQSSRLEKDRAELESKQRELRSVGRDARESALEAKLERQERERDGRAAASKARSRSPSRSPSPSPRSSNGRSRSRSPSQSQSQSQSFDSSRQHTQEESF